MKKKTINVGGKEIVVDAYETEFGLHDQRTVEEFNQQMQREEQFDKEMDPIVRELADMVSSAITADRALRYWEVGDKMFQLQQRLDQSGRTREPYEAVGKIFKRVEEKLEEQLRGKPGVVKDSYSVPYLLKMYRLRKKMTREQVDRPIPYPLYHELLYHDLTEAEVNEFLDRCANKEIRSNAVLREEVAKLRESKGVRRPKAATDQG